MSHVIHHTRPAGPGNREGVVSTYRRPDREGHRQLCAVAGDLDAKPYIAWVIAEFFVLLIEPLQLTTISRVCNLIIIHLALIIPLCHECGFFRV